MMQQFERAMRTNMASAERDMKKPEDRRGFVIGAVLQLWQTYQGKKINEQQFDQLIKLLSRFSKGEYKVLITEMVQGYKDGNPPTIVGY